MAKRFQRVKEDFICGQCGQKVKGSGYTNHCPRCLWSRHVDINPGDRAAGCGGLMEPIGLEMKAENYIITHQCIACGHKKKNKKEIKDSFEAILGLTK